MSSRPGSRRESEEAGEARLSRLAVVCGQRNALDAELVALTHDQMRAGIGGQGYVSMAHWVAHRTGASSGHAARVVRIAARCEALPVCYTAFREGRLSFDQMYAVARRVPSANDAEACELALLCTPNQLDRLFAKYPWPEPFDDGREPAKIRATTVRYDDDGDVRLRSCLPAEQGMVVDTALLAHHDVLMRQWFAEQKAAEKANEPFRTPMPTMSDALERMADRSLNPLAGDRLHAKRTHAVLHVDIDRHHATAHLGPAIGDAARRALTCDATFRVLYERNGIPLGIGRRSREIPERTRTAVEHRDGGCRVPGCTARILQIHHVHHWEDGGPTDPENLIALCPAHHRMHHHGDLGILGTDATSPDGITFTTRIGCPLVGVVGGIPPEPDDPPPAAEAYEHPIGERLNARYVTFKE